MGVCGSGVCECVWLYVRVHACVVVVVGYVCVLHVCMCVGQCMCLCICVCACVCMCVHVCMYVCVGV